MHKKIYSIKVVGIISLLLFSLILQAMEPGTEGAGRILTTLISLKTSFRTETLFVTIPADFGETVVTSTGMLAISPFVTLTMPFTASPQLTIQKTSYIISNKFLGGFGRVIAGVPFYITKKIFWDSPLYLWNLSTDQLPFYEHTYIYNWNKKLNITIIPKSKHITNRSFSGNNNPTFTYKTENCNLNLEGKNVILNGKHYLSKNKIYSIKVNKDFSLLINGELVTPKEEQ